ncbi:DUF4377 domain-containing protein [Aliikangiella marina]|uniref:DUF4377 domain-containing protein n=1 Tax=Aliikangiella marina TaxID=1712262 RepID=A0A545TJA7_9GAMM|nr:DUF4377 domain-containing protein [Aliikangiella marina]TQV77319.1 DUF4377 domain-containing protein [Aliikangiella marina]
MNKHTLLAAITLVSLTGCDSGSNRQQPELSEFLIASNKTVCTGLAQRSCLQVNIDGGTQVNNVFESIEGFDFEWGVTSRIQVEVSNLDNPPQDASSVSYELYSIDSQIQDPIGTEYQYQNVEVFTQTISLEEGQYRFLGDDIDCQPIDCDTIIQMADMGAIINLTFTFNGDGQIELTDWN